MKFMKVNLIFVECFSKTLALVGISDELHRRNHLRLQHLHV
jgi:hypothetical protein